MALSLVAFSAPTGARASGQAEHPSLAPDYTVGAEDVLDFTVLKYDELNGPITVRPDGKINVPLVGEVQAAGRTVEDIQSEVARRMEQFIPQSHLTLRVRTVNSIKVYVTGRVESPGMFQVGKPITILQAIAMAKGFTPWAKESRMTLVRSQTGKRVRVNYAKVVKGKQENFTLYPGDTLIVP